MYNINNLIDHIKNTKDGLNFLKNINYNHLKFFLNNTLKNILPPTFDFITIPNGFLINSLKITISDTSIIISNYNTIISKIEKQPSLLILYQNFNHEQTIYMIISDNIYYYQKEKENQIPIGGSLTNIYTQIKDKQYFEYQRISIDTSPKKIMAIDPHISTIFSKLEQLVTKEELTMKKKLSKIKIFT